MTDDKVLSAVTLLTTKTIPKSKEHIDVRDRPVGGQTLVWWGRKKTFNSPSVSWFKGRKQTTHAVLTVTEGHQSRAPADIVLRFILISLGHAYITDLVLGGWREATRDVQTATPTQRDFHQRINCRPAQPGEITATSSCAIIHRV